MITEAVQLHAGFDLCSLCLRLSWLRSYCSRRNASRLEHQARLLTCRSQLQVRACKGLFTFLTLGVLTTVIYSLQFYT